MSDQLLYSITDAAARLGVGRSLMYEMLGDGRLFTVKIGRRRLVPAEELERFVAELRAGTTTP